MIIETSTSGIAKALNIYLRELEHQRLVCSRNKGTAAIHTKGKELQIYRQFKVCKSTVDHLRRAVDTLEGWEASLFFGPDGKRWSRMQGQIENRMKKHSKLNSIITKGISWNGRPILIHAYKFEPDLQMKVELVIPDISNHIQELPLTIVSDALECHEHLIPDCMAEPRPPYERHETDFMTIKEYLEKMMPKGLYASRFLLDQG